MPAVVVVLLLGRGGGSSHATRGCAMGGNFNEPEREREADQDDERSEQLAPARMLSAHEPGSEDPDDRYTQRERSNG